jgi:UDPglucose--hexose-1-phosphate uridylyltransferase
VGSRLSTSNEETVAVSKHTLNFPYSTDLSQNGRGAHENILSTALSEYDPKCYLCPGNARASGEKNPSFDETFVFTNDFSAVKESYSEYSQSGCTKESNETTLLRATPVTGKCYVICFSPKHNLTLADLHPLEIATVVETWTTVYRSHLSPRSPLLPQKNGITNTNGHTAHGTIPGKSQLKYMQIFENKGPAMGCSNPHPHGQIWTTTFIPDEPATELLNLQNYRRDKTSHLLVDYATLELQKKERVIYSNSSFLVVCPWWATWPFETMIIACSHRRALTDFSADEKADLADAISKVVVKYDNLFETSFPYTMGIHQAPLDCSDGEAQASHFHIHFYPPLLRSATVKKFMVG